MKHDRGNSMVTTATDLGSLRRDADRIASRLDWPGPADEYWRRTDISSFDFESYPAQAGQAHIKNSGEFILRNEAELSRTDLSLLNRCIETSRDKVEAFHYSRLNSGFSLTVPKGKLIEEPAVIRLNGSSGAHQASFALIRAEEGSAGELLIILEDPHDEESLRSTSFHFELEPGSSLRATLIQDLGRQSSCFAFHTADVADDASFSFAEIDLGAALSVSAPVFNTMGQGANIDIAGLYAVAEGQHKNLRPVQRHAEAHGASNSLYKGALVPGARTVFQGLIRVEPGAVKTDAYLSNKNLLLEDGARADSIPSLQILNNDVRCTHGSTTGKLDPEQLFYLQSRGFGREEAERILLTGFYEEAIGKLSPRVAEEVRTRLNRHPLFAEKE